MPTTIHVAFTAPVNPAGTKTLITRTKLWAGLERKVRHAQDFVPVFHDCRVLEEKVDAGGNTVVRREAYLKDGMMTHVTERKIQEVCTLFAPTKVDFLSPANFNSLAQNVISDGPGMRDEDLLLTYVFDWTYPDVEAGSTGEEEKIVEQKKGAEMAILKTLESVRRMIEEGSL